MGAAGRGAFTFLREGMSFRAGRLYETFWNSQSNTKWSLVFIYPGFLYFIRWRAETQYKYRVCITDDTPKPAPWTSMSWVPQFFTKHRNGEPFYQKATATVEDIKRTVYGDKAVPENIRVGCRGRMMENTDNLALAVRTYCKRDPMLLFWQEN